MNKYTYYLLLIFTCIALSGEQLDEKKNNDIQLSHVDFTHVVARQDEISSKLKRHFYTKKGLQFVHGTLFLFQCYQVINFFTHINEPTTSTTTTANTESWFSTIGTLPYSLLKAIFNPQTWLFCGAQIGKAMSEVALQRVIDNTKMIVFHPETAEWYVESQLSLMLPLTELNVFSKAFLQEAAQSNHKVHYKRSLISAYNDLVEQLEWLMAFMFYKVRHNSNWMQQEVESIVSQLISQTEALGLRLQKFLDSLDSKVVIDDSIVDENFLNQFQQRLTAEIIQFDRLIARSILSNKRSKSIYYELI